MLQLDRSKLKKKGGKPNKQLLKSVQSEGRRLKPGKKLNVSERQPRGRKM